MSETKTREEEAENIKNKAWYSVLSKKLGSTQLSHAVARIELLEKHEVPTAREDAAQKWRVQSDLEDNYDIYSDDNHWICSDARREKLERIVAAHNSALAAPQPSEKECVCDEINMRHCPVHGNEAPTTQGQPDAETGISLIANERRRQVSEEGWSASHDDSHTQGELAEAGAAYALVGKLGQRTQIFTVRDVPINSARADYFELFPWEPEYWKPSVNPIRNLVKAGALIAAEIDRLLRTKNVPLISTDDTKRVDAGEKEKESPWIRTAERAPTEKDGRFVFTLHKQRFYNATLGQTVAKNTKRYLYWMPIPKLPTEVKHPTIDQIMWMSPTEKQFIPAWHVLNLAIKEAWSERDYGLAITAMIFYPIFWVVSFGMKRHFTKIAQSAAPTETKERL